MVPKAFKEVKQQVDIVGKGRGDHGGSSWKGFAVFSRRTCHYRLCQVIYAHPSLISVDCGYPIELTVEVTTPNGYRGNSSWESFTPKCGAQARLSGILCLFTSMIYPKHIS